MANSRAGYLVAFSLVAFSLAGAARAADPFYEGKTITLISPHAPGDSGDLDCRLFAQFMPKYIPGNPAMVVKYMPSNDSVSALNYVGKDAKKDGLNMVCGAYGVTNAVVKPAPLQVDLAQFNYVMGDGDSNRGGGVCSDRNRRRVSGFSAGCPRTVPISQRHVGRA